jgi:hypothetical protein
MRRILIASIQWKVGKPQIKIRKAGIINMILMIENEIIDQDQLLDSYKDLIPHLKNCLNDDWAPELRLASCEFLEKYLNATKYLFFLRKDKKSTQSNSDSCTLFCCKD